MKCRSCQAEIAEKAIVCYRCGTPTADLAPVPRTPPPAPRARLWIVPVMLAIIAAAVWLVPLTAAGPERNAAWGTVAIVTFGAVWLARRRRRPRRRR